MTSRQYRHNVFIHQEVGIKHQFVQCGLVANIHVTKEIQNHLPYLVCISYGIAIPDAAFYREQKIKDIRILSFFIICR